MATVSPQKFLDLNTFTDQFNVRRDGEIVGRIRNSGELSAIEQGRYGKMSVKLKELWDRSDEETTDADIKECNYLIDELCKIIYESTPDERSKMSNEDKSRILLAFVTRSSDLAVQPMSEAVKSRSKKKK